MILLIPLGGIGDRFKKEGYNTPKALIDVDDKAIIFWLLDNINTSALDYIYIIYNNEYDNLEKVIRERYSRAIFKFLRLTHHTKGALETVSIGLKHLTEDDCTPIICVDCDNFYMTDIIDLWKGNNTIITFIEPHSNTIPKYSYITIDDDNIVTDIKEKNKISNIACCGAYGFASLKLLREASSIVLEKEEYMIGNEYYISSVIKYMISNGVNFTNNTIDNKDYFSLGTPQQIRDFGYIYLLDLDGTLVDTDNLYYNIWKEILTDYNIIVDKEYFNKFIKGKSDKNFLKLIIPHITLKEIETISILKDDLFIKNIDKVEIFDGVVNFLQSLINNRTAIVTNCNRTVVIAILEYFNIAKYINKIISADDCKNTKPDKEPYLTALAYFKKYPTRRDINRCIVFEDSAVGYLSAKNANIPNIYIKNNNTIILANNFEDYNNLNISLDELDRLNVIRDSFYARIYNINCNNLKCDGGYICNIYKYNLIFEDYSYVDIIVKVSNNESTLSHTALKLDLYKNEKNFYNFIAPKININIPEHYNVCEDNNKVYIILKDLTKMQGVFNINLNNNFCVLYNVIIDISKLHISNYYKCEKDIPPYMSDVKKIRDYTYYSELIKERYNDFITRMKEHLTNDIIWLFNKIYLNYNKLIDIASTFPISLCHGDLKSPNIFYKNKIIPYFLDFQYINLNKGVSDIIFLLVESVDFNEEIYEDTLTIYYNRLINNGIKYNYNTYRDDIKNALCIFPFFVMIWFNTTDGLNDNTFPLQFMNKLIKYYRYEFKYLLKSYK